MALANTISLLGGLAFFLFGMTLLGEGLKRVAGSKMETILGKLTSNTFKGVTLGALVTAVIQSSSATTVMVVGFVNSGIMKLANAIGIIMGANIGTTATGWILVLAGVEGSGGFSSATVFALIAFVGIIFYFFCKKQSTKNVGMIMLAFSVLMSGMQSMSGAMEPLKQSQIFIDFISAVSNPLVALASPSPGCAHAPSPRHPPEAVNMHNSNSITQNKNSTRLGAVFILASCTDLDIGIKQFDKL